MVISKLIYKRDLDLAQSSMFSPLYIYDKRFLIKQFIDQISYNSQLGCKLREFDSELVNNLYSSTINRIQETGYDTPNTVVNLTLPEDGKLRGELNISYDRVTLHDYFNIPEVVEGEETIVEWKDWLAAVKDTDFYALSRLINQAIGYKFGRTMVNDGFIVYDGVKYKSKNEVVSHRGLAMIIPSMGDIEEGFKQMRNIRNEDKASSLKTQVLNVHIRVVSNNHLFIEDGEAIVKLGIRRYLGYFNKQHEEMANVRN